MAWLDLATVMLISMAVYILCSIALFVLWWSNRNRYSEIFYLMLGMSFCALGNFIQMLRATIPMNLSIIFGNPLIIGGLFMLAYGIRRHLRTKTRLPQMGALLILFSIIHAVFTFAVPSLVIRITNFSAFIVISSLFCMVPFLTEKSGGLSTKAVALSFGLTALIGGIRISALYLLPFKVNPEFMLHGFDSVFLFIFILLIITITYSLTLLVHSRLNADLIVSEDKFSKIFRSTTFPILITQLENGLIHEVNQGFEQTFGHKAQDITGKTSSEFEIWEDLRDHAVYVEQMIRTGIVRNKEFRFKTKAGIPLVCLLSADNLLINGETRTLVTLVDITKIKKDEEEIRNLLKEKDYLMKEIHHRVKNNLNTVFSLLSIQASEDHNPVSSNAINTAAGRVQSMAYLYDKLHSTENLKQASIKEYLPPLMKDVLALFPSNSMIQLEMDLEDFSLTTRQLSNLGLIINELMTNSFKHAFKHNKPGIIRLTSFRSQNRILLVYSDNGIGFDQEHKASGGFGLELVNILLEQIQATIECESKPEKGVSFRISLPLA